MKWFQLDTNAPGSRTVMRVLNRMGNEGFGALVRLWCWVGERGQKEPGRAVDSDGKPYEAEDLMAACGLDELKFDDLITICLDTEHIDREAWEQRGELFFPGMLRRSDEYTKRRMRSGGITVESVRTLSGQNPPTVQDKTVQDQESDHGGAVTLFPLPDPPHVIAEKIRDDWNRITTPPIPRCHGLTEKRRRHVLARLREHGREGLQNVFRIVEATAFCRGENDRGWRATFDWVTGSPEVPLKILEGKYGGTRGRPTRPSGAMYVPSAEETTEYLERMERAAKGGRS